MTDQRERNDEMGLDLLDQIDQADQLARGGGRKAKRQEQSRRRHLERDQRRDTAAAKREQREADRLARRPPQLRQTNRDFVPFSVPPHKDTTARIQGLFPFVAESGLTAPGWYCGRNMLSGGSFVFDPFWLYLLKLSTNPNGAIFGDVGYGKSATAKLMILRGLVFGIRSVVPCDVKGEYDQLCAFLGIKPIYLGPGLRNRLNPLDVPPRPAGMSDGEWLDEVNRSRSSTMGSLLQATLNRELSQSERRLVDVGLAELTGQDRGTDVDRMAIPTLPLLADAMAGISNETAKAETFRDAEHFISEARDAVLALRRLTNGDLRGMFDGPSTVKLDFDDPLSVINLSRLQVDDASLALIMTCSQAWMEQALMRQDGVRRMLWYDECWRLLRVGNGELIKRLSSQQKLARQWGISNWLIMHRIKDLAGGSLETRAIAEGLLEDTATRIIYHQDHRQLEFTQQALGLTDSETDEIGSVQPCEALWQLDIQGQSRSFMVDSSIRTGSREHGLIQTNSKMHGQRIDADD